MPTLDDVMKHLEAGGTELKTGLWKPEDAPFLKARAKDLVGLAAKAKSQTDEAKRAAYLAAARDTMTSIKLLALVRMEAASSHLFDTHGKSFMGATVQRLTKLLPGLGDL